MLRDIETDARNNRFNGQRAEGDEELCFFPLFTNHERPKVLALLNYVGDEGLLQATIDHLLKQKLLTGDAKRIARADFKPKLSINQRKLKDKLIAAIYDGLLN